MWAGKIFDPAETNNLAEAHLKRADELEKRLFAHFKSIGHDLKARPWKVGFNPVYAFPSQDDPKKE